MPKISIQTLLSENLSITKCWMIMAVPVNKFQHSLASIIIPADLIKNSLLNFFQPLKGINILSIKCINSSPHIGSLPSIWSTVLKSKVLVI